MNSRALPLGFRAFGLRAGINKNPSKPDLALFCSDAPCAAAAVFTTNRVQAAPVRVSREHVRGKVRAIVANSGCANACTGTRGLSDARAMCRETARALGVSPREVLAASTGVIGAFLPMGKIVPGIDALAGKLRGGSDPASAVHAIMTTDTVPKSAGARVRLGGKTVTLWGCVKGAGMIHPNMATMLSFILTDADLPSGLLRKMLRRAADGSFNSLSVDGDTSTNDCVFLLANGRTGASPANARELEKFQAALDGLCLSLALQMASDGEGATKRIEISVRGAKTAGDARKIARTVATSPLVKTAFFGNDANWGRILAAAGRSGADFDPERVEVSFGPLRVCRRGAAVPFSESRARKVLRAKVVPLAIELNQGRGEARYLTCDFSLDYVRINAEYRT